MEKPKLTNEIMQSERLRAKYVHDVIDYLAWKWDVKHALSEPIETNQNKY